MNESIYGSGDSKNTGTTQYGDDTGRTKSLGSKLKNKDTARKYYGEMLRGERTTKELEPEEARRRAKIRAKRHKKVKQQIVSAEKERQTSTAKRESQQQDARDTIRSEELKATRIQNKKAAENSEYSFRNSSALSGVADTANAISKGAGIGAYMTGVAGNDQDEDYVAEEALETGGYVASGAVSSVTQKVKSSKYGNKLHQRELSGGGSEAEVKERLRKEMQKRAAAKRAAAAENSGFFGKRLTDESTDLTGLLAERTREMAEEHPIIAIIILLLLIVVLMFAVLAGTFGMIGGNNGDIAVITTYTAEDEEILAVEDDYKELEADLQDDLNNLDTSGYDEVNYYVDEVGHNPYQLAAILTVMFENYTRAEVQGMLQTIFNLQYEFYTEEVEETRQHEVEYSGVTWVEDSSHEDGGYWQPYSYTVTEDYQYYILNVYLINHTLDEVVEELGFTEDEMIRYKVLLETFGNKKYLFGEDDYYNTPDDHPGDDDNYHVPGEYLTDEQFARMLHEAESHLGTPYVWGGYSPSGFDCSGFVSWVINHCGNGWNVGRQTANGLRAITDYVSPADAKPGDLIFFHGTYDTAGCSHVGIYVGNGMMIHAGNPVKYSSINTPYWQAHFDSFGRIR
ncbi:NlpC/P60 family protein [Butyrivibrio sp. ob235]|uniref:C40 family peptidase n=1 Tax=Butyrivibrio sp. ob235 TaxID=1761780 RepID=UPI0008C2DF2D|nr:C40 family peptidase [Butyrivibrio sp. ob235]SEM20281.1 NlpC/P60 family protein [Butyrivibrio sp. ob235]